MTQIVLQTVAEIAVVDQIGIDVGQIGRAEQIVEPAKAGRPARMPPQSARQAHPCRRIVSKTGHELYALAAADVAGHDIGGRRIAPQVIGPIKFLPIDLRHERISARPCLAHRFGRFRIVEEAGEIAVIVRLRTGSIVPVGRAERRMSPRAGERRRQPPGRVRRIEPPCEQSQRTTVDAHARGARPTALYAPCRVVKRIARQREGLGYRRTAKPPLGRSLDERRRQRMTLAPTFGDRRIDGPIVGIDAPDAGVVSPTARHGCRNGPASAHEPGASADTQAVAEPAFGKHPPEAPAPHVGRRIGLELAESRFGAECESTGKHAARHRAGHVRLPESRHRAPTHRPRRRIGQIDPGKQKATAATVVTARCIAYERKTETGQGLP